MSKSHILRNYGRKTDAAVGDFTLHVADSLDGNGNFTSPAIIPAILRTKAGAFAIAIAACEDGTKQDTEHKNNLRDDLISTLDQEADYVELTAKGDREMLLSSGFDVTTATGTSPAPVGTTAILSVTNVSSGKLGIELEVADNAWAYDLEVSSAPGIWVHNNTFTDPHNVMLVGLTAGTMYAIRARAIGSKNQYSEWCEPVNHMAT
jgi:hypothetical protein